MLQRRPLVGTALPTQNWETVSDFSLSENDGFKLFDGLDGNEELELDEELEQALDDTQPTLSSHVADDVGRGFARSCG